MAAYRDQNRNRKETCGGACGAAGTESEICASWPEMAFILSSKAFTVSSKVKLQLEFDSARRLHCT